MSRARAIRASWVAVAAALAVGPGCSASTDTVCPDAETRLGMRVCEHRIGDRGTWTELTFETAAVDSARATTYLVPAHGAARLAPLFVDANAFQDPQTSLHFKFLTESFDEYRFLDYDQYLELVLDPTLREWFAGSVTEFIDAERAPIFGFTIADLGIDPSATITCDQMRDVFRVLDGRISIGDVAFVPSNELQRQQAAACDVPVHDPATSLAYEAYTVAKGCGTVRRYTAAELAVAEQQAEFGFQDIIVVDQAPLDIAAVVSGLVTGTRQGELSHLNVRSASRGTPNCYVRGGYDLLAQWEGQLVELDCQTTRATVVPITVSRAQQCWDELRPEPVDVVPADLLHADLTPLLSAPTGTATERRQNVSRYGSKGANLAALYQRISADLQLTGFLVPFRYYDEFMRNNSWTVDVGQGPEQLTFADTIERYLGDPVFMSDGALRRQFLEALQAQMRSTTCDPALLDQIATQVQASFGSQTVMVRFRSSSNAEDALGFNGAGLYDSTSVCVADDLDGDSVGPSACDPDKSSERAMCRGLTKVWASLWNPSAYIERDFFGIDQRAVAMAVLVNTRSKSELANIVAFTGNPQLAGDDRYLVNAQLGELDVVAAVPGIWPEKDLLTMAGGSVVAIERARGSTELPAGQYVLDDAQLGELGAALAQIADAYPVDETAPPNRSVLLDTEWKLRADGRLAIKQIRPFLD